MRLDQLLFEQKQFPSREKAKAAVLAGIIYVDGKQVTKAGTNVDSDAIIEVKGKTLPYVSRGGLKLEKALEVFPVNTHDKVCLDIGASTGGFTDCLLQNGAQKVYAIDVGYGQLEWKLRADPRVIVMERTNIRYVTPDDIPDLADLAVIDVSFISLTKVIPPVINLLTEHGELIALIKPQFEAGRAQVGKKGVVRSKDVHVDVLSNLISRLQKLGMGLVGLDFSPITGPEGNIEYLTHFILKASHQDNPEAYQNIVDQAWLFHK